MNLSLQFKPNSEFSWTAAPRNSQRKCYSAVASLLLPGVKAVLITLKPSPTFPQQTAINYGWQKAEMCMFLLGNGGFLLNFFAVSPVMLPGKCRARTGSRPEGRWHLRRCCLWDFWMLWGRKLKQTMSRFCSMLLPVKRKNRAMVPSWAASSL